MSLLHYQGVGVVVAVVMVTPLVVVAHTSQCRRNRIRRWRPVRARGAEIQKHHLLATVLALCPVSASK